MIQKPNSCQLMDEFAALQKDIADIHTDLAETTEQINTKLQIIGTYNLMLAQEMADIKKIPEAARKKDYVIFGLEHEDKIVGGTYDIYGNTIHSAFRSLPGQVFNLITETGPLYKDCASVSFISVNDNGDEVEDYQYQYNNILKHEADPSKQDVFKNFDTENITLRIKLNHTNIYGDTNCNMIEICPYLPGSFDINAIRIYTVTQHLTEKENMIIPDGQITTPIKNVGACRFLLNGKTYQLYQIEMDIRIHEFNKKYPFGLRHIYFYDAKMDTTDDYAVIALSQDKYIESIGKKIVLETPFGSKEASIDEYGVEFYMTFDQNTLQNKINAGDVLARNLKTIYVKVPFSMPNINNINKRDPYCLTGIRFKDITLR